MTSWIVPGVVFPVMEGQLIPVRVALRESVIVAWWRQREPPPADSRLEILDTASSRQIALGGPYEAYWNKTKLLKEVRRARRRCDHLTVEVNRPGAAEWTILNWGRKWAAPGTESVPGTNDRVIVARYWEPRGRHFTVSLVDGDRIAASGVVFAHGNVIVGLVNYRGSAYDHLGLGKRLHGAIFRWASKNSTSGVAGGTRNAGRPKKA